MKGAVKDHLGLFDGDEPKYRDIMRILGFTKKHTCRISCIAIAGVLGVITEKDVSLRLMLYFHQLANLINLVAGFFDGDKTKTKLWFRLNNPCLGNISPRNMILMDRYEKLLKFVVNSLDENTR